MTPFRLILLLLLILVAVVVVLVVLRRGSAQRDAQRVEAAGLRADADALATTVAGQSVFADQAAQRAELARVEAEDKASEAARLEAEAAEHRAAAEASQRDYEATLRRADDIDPDVKQSEFPAVADEVEPAAAVSGSTDAAPADTGSTDAAPAATGSTDAGSAPAETGAAAAAVARDDDDVPMTRAARREAREAESGSETAAASVAPAAAGAAAVGGVAAGTTAWTGRGDDESNPESERIASAADYRDDVPDDTSDPVAAAPGEATTELEPHSGSESEAAEVYAADDTGTGSGMSNDAHTDTAEHTPHEDGLGAGQAAAAASAGAGGAYAATRALHEEHTDDAVADEASDAAADDTTEAAAGDTTDAGDDTVPAVSTGDTDADERRSEPADDLSHDVESPRGEWGGPPQDEPAEMTIVDPEAYAATEPLMASEQGAPVQPEAVDTDGDTTVGQTSDVETTEHEPTEHAPAEAGAAVAETDDTDRSAAQVAQESTEERYDPTPTRDWAADEGELLEETHDRGDRLEAERADLAEASEAPASGDVTEAPASGDASEAPASGDVTDAPASGEPASPATEGRRISGFEELRDGGFGVGSAAPLDDGAQPLDHPVAAYRDTMTYRLPGDAGYDSAEPHVWFYDEGAAERSGFRRSQG
ncbi:MAG TPA: hypothetical protein VFL10_01340 [Ornithinibacter sp.]|nr:hypothetical protein [Ornithinibacter sp.]